MTTKKTVGKSHSKFMHEDRKLKNSTRMHHKRISHIEGHHDRTDHMKCNIPGTAPEGFAGHHVEVHGDPKYMDYISKHTKTGWADKEN